MVSERHAALSGKLTLGCVISSMPVQSRAELSYLAFTKGATVVDAVVMASAASRGDRVLTSDFDDLDRLRSYFPEVRLLQT